ncbi:MAG: transglutaminase family protein [Pseudomonadales bacterium]|nr:transglutaminase family protein [Pseudomonadales bacterium]
MLECAVFFLGVVMSRVWCLGISGFLFTLAWMDIHASELSLEYDAWTQSATYEIEYVIDLSVLPRHRKVNLWVPKPANNFSQRVLSAHTSSIPASWQMRDLKDNRGNAIVEFVLPADPERSETLSFSYVIERDPGYIVPKDAMQKGDVPEDYLAPTNMIPLQGLIASIAEKQRQGITDQEELQRIYYDYIFDSMRYSKEGEGWGQGDAIWACQSKYGNCTDFHSLYIGLVRSQKIPARFKIGFPLSASNADGRHDGYHCWAEVYSDTEGWLPLDASEAKKADLRDKYYGKLPSDRVEFSQGRDLIFSELQRGDPVNYFIYPYAETTADIIDRLPVKLLYRRVGVVDSNAPSKH